MLYTLFWGSLLTELSHALRTLLRQNTPREVYPEPEHQP